MRDNRWALLCPCCGATICGKCGQYEDRLASAVDSYEGTGRYARGVRRAWAKHKREVDHRYMDDDGTSLGKVEEVAP